MIDFGGCKRTSGRHNVRSAMRLFSHTFWQENRGPLLWAVPLALLLFALLFWSIGHFGL
jgi:hypothetical protein